MEKYKLQENCFVVMSLIFMTEGLQTIFPASILTVLRYFILFISIILIIIRINKTIYILSKNILLTLLILLIISSILWSTQSSATFINLYSIFIPTTIFGIYFSTSYKLKEQLNLIAISFGIILYISVLFVLTVPSKGIHNEIFSGAWKGIFIHKNGLGQIASLSGSIFLLKSIYKDRVIYWNYLGVITSVILILMSTSKSSLVSFILLGMLGCIYRLFRWRGEKTLLIMNISILALGFSSVFLIDNWNFLLSSLGKDPTLSGRTLIWKSVISKIELKPLFGYGKNAFWSLDNKYFTEISGLTGFNVPNAHNGYLEMLLDIGFIGFFLFLGVLIFAYVKSIRIAYRSVSPEQLWPLIFLTAVIIINISESSMNSINWCTFIAISYSIESQY